MTILDISILNPYCMTIPNGMTPIAIPQSLSMVNSFPLAFSRFSRVPISDNEAVIDIGTFQVVAYPGADLINDITAWDILII